MDERSILDHLDRQARDRGDRPALAEPRDGRFDTWDTLTWRDYAEQVYALARALIALGHQPRDPVAILGPNVMAWALADLAAIAAGGMPAGIYATLTPEQSQHVVRHSRASILFAGDARSAAKILAAKETLPHLKAVVLFPGQEGRDGSLVWAWAEAIARGRDVPGTTLDQRRRSLTPRDPATLIYTSGTTGPAKAVTLSHQNLVWTAGAAKILTDAAPGDRGLSYLPLAHIAEQMLTLHVPITIGVTMHFLPAMERLPDALRAVRPATFFGVPRVWEKIQAKVEAGVQSASPAKQRLFRAAQRVGTLVERARFEGRSASPLERLLYPLFDRLVFAKLRERLGLDHARLTVSGAAPMSQATRDWFLSVGIPISEVYGQSEGSGPTSFNQAGKGRLGTAGRPIPGVDVRIAEDGEVLVRGPNVFLGYLHDPTATGEARDAEGWLHSGDVGTLDEDGFLTITDRKKDLIITAGGKNVAPQNIEKLLREIPLVSQAVVVGDRRKFLTALLTLEPEALRGFQKDAGLDLVEGSALAAHPKVRAAIQQAIDEAVNPRLARYETIKRFEILPEELREDRGEVTPTMKIRRNVVGKRYAAAIEKLYQSEDLSTA